MTKFYDKNCWGYSIKRYEVPESLLNYFHQTVMLIVLFINWRKVPQVDIYKFGRSGEVLAGRAINIEAEERPEADWRNGSSPAGREIRAGGNSEEAAATQGRARLDISPPHPLDYFIKTYLFHFEPTATSLSSRGVKGVTGVIVVNGTYHISWSSGVGLMLCFRLWECHQNYPG